MVEFLTQARDALRALLANEKDLRATVEELAAILDNAIEREVLDCEYLYSDCELQQQVLPGVDDQERVGEAPYYANQRVYSVDARLPCARAVSGDVERLRALVAERLGGLPAVGLVLPRKGRQETFRGDDVLALTAKAFEFEKTGWPSLPEPLVR